MVWPRGSAVVFVVVSVLASLDGAVALITQRVHSSKNELRTASKSLCMIVRLRGDVLRCNIELRQHRQNLVDGVGRIKGRQHISIQRSG